MNFKNKYLSCIFCLVCASSQASDIVVNDGEWEINYQHELVMLANDGIAVPIETVAPTFNVTHNKYGAFSISRGSMTSATSIPVGGASTLQENYNNRPTLFISIGGAKNITEGLLGLDESGNGVHSWQRSDGLDLSDIITNTINQNHQFAYMYVDWHSLRQSKPQVKNLAEVVSEFLENRTHVWDVAVVGHSRGGVFAHELSRYLVKNEKISNLHTLLLDPTAAPSWGDSYPSYKHTSNKTNHYANNLIDGNKFMKYVTVTTFSDERISGYDHAVMDDTGFEHEEDYKTDHGNITTHWLKRGYAQAWIQKIINLKQGSGQTYSAETDLSSNNIRQVTIKFKSELVWDGDMSISGDKVEVSGTLQVGAVSASQHLYIDGNGAEVTANVIVASAAAAISEDKASISSSAGTNSYVMSLEDKNISGQQMYFFGSGGISYSVGEDGLNININILDKNAEVLSITNKKDLDRLKTVMTGGLSDAADEIKSWF